MNRTKSRVLVVDDKAYVRLALSDRLDIEGYETATASNSTQALEHIRDGDQASTSIT